VRSCHRWSSRRYRRCGGGTQLDDVHDDDAVDSQHVLDSVDDHDAQDTDATAGFNRTSLSEYGQVRLELRIGLRLEFRLGI
jgi:hypothetical protein